MKRLAVLMTCHNRREKTVSCLRRLFAQHGIDDVEVTVFLVDDGCTDGTGDAVQKEFPAVVIIPGNGELFWNQGMRLAWDTASKQDCDYYLWLNDDTFLFDNALAVLLHTIRSLDGERHIVVGATSSANDPVQTTYSGRVTRGGLIPPNGRMQPCEEFNGNVVLIPAAVFRELGNLDPFFRHSFGDIEYGMRARKAGIICWVAPQHVGHCEKNTAPSRWTDPAVPLRQRLKHFYSPLGLPPAEMFHLNRTYNGLAVACRVWLTNHLRCIWPSVLRPQQR